MGDNQGETGGGEEPCLPDAYYLAGSEPYETDLANKPNSISLPILSRDGLLTAK